MRRHAPIYLVRKSRANASRRLSARRKLWDSSVPASAKVARCSSPTDAPRASPRCPSTIRSAADPALRRCKVRLMTRSQIRAFVDSSSLERIREVLDLLQKLLDLRDHEA